MDCVQARGAIEQLAQDNRLSPTESDALEEHCACCDHCNRAAFVAIHIELGDCIQRHELIDVLGKGGMGVVYLAFDRELERQLAIKVVRSGRGGAFFRERRRLLREARAMARVSHPNVVQLHDVGTCRGQVFLVMEFVQGGTLRDWLNSEERSWQSIIALFVQAGRGLAALHTAGLVHRDIKPGNILVTRDGIPKVTDLGLVTRSAPVAGELAVMHGTGAAEAVPGGVSAGSAERVAGTPRYMSPEQIAGQGVSTRSDQYSFCLVLQEALQEQRDGRAWRALPAALRAAIERGQSVAPADRFPSMDALLAELARPRESRLHSSRWLLVGFGLLAVTSLLGGAVAWQQTRAKEAQARAAARAALMAEEQGRRARDAARMAALDRWKGNSTMQLVLLRDIEARTPPDRWEAEVRRALHRPLSTLVRTGRFANSAGFAPDGQHIVVGGKDGTLTVWAADGSGRSRSMAAHAEPGDARGTLRAPPEVWSACFSPDGKFIVSASADDSLQVRQANGQGEPLVLRGHVGDVRSARYSPDGRHIVSASDDTSVRVWSADGREEALVFKGHTDLVYDASYSPDGSHIVSASADGTVRVWRADGRAGPLVLTGHADHVVSAAYSPDGTHIVSSSRDGTVRIWPAHGRTKPRVLTGMGDTCGPLATARTVSTWSRPPTTTP